jgi:hypothetical protein
MADIAVQGLKVIDTPSVIWLFSPFFFILVPLSDPFYVTAAATLRSSFCSFSSQQIHKIPSLINFTWVT